MLFFKKFGIMENLVELFPMFEIKVEKNLPDKNN